MDLLDRAHTGRWERVGERAVTVSALLLSDSRFPAGGHAHSGGVEPAVTAGIVIDLESLEAFLRGRLRTAGLAAAGLAAPPACASRAAPAPETPGMCLTPRRMPACRRRHSGGRRGGRAGRCCAQPGWPGRMTAALAGAGVRPREPGTVTLGPGRAASCGCARCGCGGGRVRRGRRGADRRVPVGGRAGQRGGPIAGPRPDAGHCRASPTGPRHRPDRRARRRGRGGPARGVALSVRSGPRPAGRSAHPSGGETL